MSVKVDAEKCDACGDCQTACPTDAIQVPEGQKAKVDPELCIDCNVCIDGCTHDAIEAE